MPSAAFPDDPPGLALLADDLVGWGMQTDAETMPCDADAPQQVAGEQEAIRLCRSVACPVLVIGGDRDKIVPPERPRRIADLTSTELLVIQGGGTRRMSGTRLLPDTEGLDKRGYVPDFFEHLACADAAVVQGGCRQR